VSLSLWPFRRRGAASAPTRPTLVIAEDEPQSRALLQGFLGEVGFGTQFVADGAALLELVERSCSSRARSRARFDVVMADVECPRRSGLDILVAVRRNGWRIPVVLTSPYVSSMLRTEVIRMGAAAILRKPLSLPELEQVLRGIVAARATRGCPD